MNEADQVSKVGIIGYGSQARVWATILRERGLDVHLGLRQAASWDRALQDGWKPKINLWPLTDLTSQVELVLGLTADTSWSEVGPALCSYWTPRHRLVLAHGFAVVYADLLHWSPPDETYLLAPRGHALSVLEAFRNKNNAVDFAWAWPAHVSDPPTWLSQLATLLGANRCHKTTFEHEVWADLTGERCVLIGAVLGLMQAQYKVLTEAGHSPQEAYSESLSEALSSIYPMLAALGPEVFVSQISQVAEDGVRRWAPRFEKALKPLIESCYSEVKSGQAAEFVIRGPKPKVGFFEGELWKLDKHTRTTRKVTEEL